MDQQTCNSQMNRLAAAYRVDVPTGTRAAYFLAFQKTRDEHFATACELAIEQERVFPSIATIKEILKNHHEATRAAKPAVPELTEGDAGYLSVLKHDRAEIEKWAAYREEHRSRYQPVFDPTAVVPPPDAIRHEVETRAAYVPIPTCFTPFVIVPKKLNGMAGFIARWVNQSERATRADACNWRRTREEIRNSMLNLYADVQEVKG